MERLLWMGLGVALWLIVSTAFRKIRQRQMDRYMEQFRPNP